MYVCIYIISESWLKGHDDMSAGITLTPASASSGPLRLTFRDAESKKKTRGICWAGWQNPKFVRSEWGDQHTFTSYLGVNIRA